MPVETSEAERLYQTAREAIMGLCDEQLPYDAWAALNAAVRAAFEEGIEAGWSGAEEMPSWLPAGAKEKP